MKRIICISVAVALAVLAAVRLVFRPPETVQIAIEHTHWAGEKDFVPTHKSETYEVRPGDVIRCGGYLDLEVAVKEISSTSVTIETNTPMSSNEESLDLLNYKTRFTIQNDEPLCLVTPTMDAGDIFVFSILQ